MTTQPRRRWFPRSFSVRTLLVLVVVLALPLAWIANEKRQSALELEIAGLASSRGGYATFDERIDHDGFKIADHSWRGLVKSVIGNRIVKLDFRRYLYDDYVVFADLTRLQHFEVNESEVADLSPISGQVGLRYLTVLKSPISDLSPLTDLIQLEHLVLTNCPVSSLEPLRGLVRLKSIELRNTKVSDLSPLANLFQLVHLDLANCPVSSVEPLRGLVQLQEVDLRNSQVADLTPLHGLVNLRRLVLAGANVSDEQVQQLKLALPKCRVINNPASVFP